MGYYEKLSGRMDERTALILDPMLATGNSAAACVDRLKKLNPRSIKFVCLLACPEGIEVLHRSHPDVPIFTAAVDRELDDNEQAQKRSQREQDGSEVSG
mgnify:CR=1 FL=1